MDCSMPGVPVPHHLLRFAQVHVRCIGEDVQPSHPLMLSSPSALSLSQHQGLSQWVLHSHQMTKIMELQLQHQSFQWIFRKIDCFDLLAVQGTFRSLLQYYLEGINSLAFCLLHGPALTTVCDHWEDHSLDYMDLCQQCDVFAFHTVEVCHSFPAKKQSSFISWLQSLTTLKPFTVWILTNCRQLLKR